MSGSGMRRGIALLGSTGSIGRSTLDVLRRQQEHFRLVALTAGRNRDEFVAQMDDWRPSYGGLAGVPNDHEWPSGPEVLGDVVPPLEFHSTYPLVDSVQSRLTVLMKREVGSRLTVPRAIIYLTKATT